MLMNKNGLTSVNGIGLNIFSNDELDSIHHGACHILKHTGVLVEMEEAAERFSSAGALVKKKGTSWLVKIPEWLVEDSLLSVAKNVTYYARDNKKNFYLEKGRVGFGTFGEQVNIIDPDTRICRNTTKEDCNNLYRLVDALDGLAWCQRAVCPGDKPAAAQAVHNFHSLITNNSKHITIGMVDKQSVETIIKMAAHAAGGIDKLRKQPICTCSCCAISPLTLGTQCCETLIAALEAGVNLNIITMALSGGTGPVTLAGTIVQSLAEILSVVVLGQIVKKGAPITIGSCSTIMDLKTGQSPVGAPEWSMIGSAIARMSQYYEVPCILGAGVSDSKVPDAQAGYEFAMNALVIALSGANMILGAGGLETGLTFDYAKLIMDHECITNIQRLISGVKIDNESMVLDLIDEVGPGGTYLTHKHTFKHTRSQSQAIVFNRKVREQWSQSPVGMDIAETAYEKAKNIIEDHQPFALPNGAKEAIDDLVKEFELKQK